jgi:hypothetical protein
LPEHGANTLVVEFNYHYQFVFAKTWFGEDTRYTAAIEAAATFRELFRELRK